MKAQEYAQQQKAILKRQQQEEIDKLASQLDSLAEDDDLLAGLEQLQQQEEIEIRKRTTGNLDKLDVGTVEQGQGSAINSNRDEEEKGNGSSYGVAGVVIALAVAGGIYAYRSSFFKR